MIDFEEYKKFISFEMKLNQSVRNNISIIMDKNSFNTAFADLTTDEIRKFSVFIIRQYALILSPIS